MRIELVKTQQKNPNAQVWMWRFKANNGRIVAAAETYETFSAAKRAARQAVRSILQVHPQRHVRVTFGEPRWTKDYYIMTWLVWTGDAAED